MNSSRGEHLTVPPDGKRESDQPRWRRDFPIDWPQDEYVSRRDFTKFMILTSLAFAIGQLWILALNFFRKRRGIPPLYRIAGHDGIAIGGALIFNYPGAHQACVLVRLTETSFVAYDQQCTHLTCPVIPQPEAGKLHCPCHEGYFDIKTGRPLSGPPRRALRRVKLETRGDSIYASGFEESA